MWSPESEINSIAMATTMRHSQSSSSGKLYLYLIDFYLFFTKSNIMNNIWELIYNS